MCAAWGISKPAYNWRIKNGRTLEETLTSSRDTIYHNAKKCKDHENREFSSVSAMCKYWGINKPTYDFRISNGWSIEDALTVENARQCEDHMGNKFDSVAKMCIYWSVSRYAYEGRIKNGWTVEEALTNSKTYVHNTAQACDDHLGNHFNTIIDMLDYWNVSRSTFDSRILMGWSLEESLTIPRKYSLGEYRVSSILRDYQVAEYFDFYYHDITIKKVFESLGMAKEYKDFLGVYENALRDNNILISMQRLSKLRFDFSLIKNKRIFAFIEYDGEQHFKYVELFFASLKDFMYRKNCDASKNVFSERNGIPLLRIRYDQIDNKKIRFMINDLLTNPDKYIERHNPYLSNEDYLAGFAEINNKLKSTRSVPVYS